jgi:hypothetical protein
MKLDCVITSVNLNHKYSQFIPLFIKSWSKLLPHIDIKIILINDCIPDKYKEFKKNIILFKPIGKMHTAFIAQYIRILYPAILNYNNGILISDMDMIPMNDFYYTENIKNISDNKFVIFRDVIPLEFKQYPICYNVATNKVWSDIFKINSLEDINARLKKAYSEIHYDNTHGGSGWDKDQRDLYSLVLKYENKVILTDKKCGYNRLDRIKFDGNIDKVKHLIENKKYSDYHGIYNYDLNVKIVDLLPKHKKDLVMLVIASTNEQIYNNLILNHWIRYINYANKNFKNIKIYLIFSKQTDISKFNDIRENILLLNIKENLIPGIFNKTMLAFDKINNSYDYKYIMRTNLSSFFRLDKLLESINNVDNIYGVIGKYEDKKFISGAGMLFTKENINYLLSNKNKINSYLPDDVALSSIFDIESHNKKLRYDFSKNKTEINFNELEDFYHFRIKNQERSNDIKIFNKLFNYYYDSKPQEENNKMKKIISYSLYGSNKKYCIGMLENLKINKKKLPDWETYIYYSEDVPEIYIEMYKEYNPVLIKCKLSEFKWEGPLWRFRLFNDKDVDIFISRDADSRITDREIEFVNDFISSDKSFHIIRDHPDHNLTILAGMFGVKVKDFNNKYKIKTINEYITDYKKKYHKNIDKFPDQYFLRDIIWPLIKDDNYSHIALERLRHTKTDIVTKYVHDFIGKDIDID